MYRGRSNLPLTSLIFMLAWLITFTSGCTSQNSNRVFSNNDGNILHLFNWNNYIAPETVRRFEKLCDCKLSQDYYSDNEEMLAKLAGGASGYDIIVPTSNAMETLIRQGALKPLDKSLLPNLKNIDPSYLETPFDPGN